MTEDRNKLIKSVAGVTLLGIAIKGLAFLKEILVASAFGTSGVMDAFLLSTSLPLLLAGAFVSALNSSVVPVVQEYHFLGQSEGRNALSAIFWRVVAYASLVAALIFVAAPMIMKRVGHALADDLLGSTIEFMRINSGLIVFMCAAYVLQAAFLIRKQFMTASMIQIMMPLTSIAVLLGLRPFLGPLVLPVGFVGGPVAFLALSLVLHRFRLQERLTFVWHHEGAVRALRLSSFLLLGQTALSVNDMIDQWVASILNTGSLSALGYAQKLLDIPTQLCVIGFSTVFLPVFGEQRTQGNRDEMAALFQGTTRLILYVTTPLAVGIIALGPLLIQLAFQRGAFTSQSTAMTYPALAAYAIGLPFFVAGFLNARLLNALQDVKIMTVIALSTLPVNLGLDWVFAGEWGHSGIALSTSVVRFASYVLVLWKIQQHHLRMDIRGLLSGAARSLGASTLIGALVYGLDHYVLYNLPTVVRLAAGGIAGVVLYFGVTWLLRCPEPATLVSQIGVLRRQGGLLRSGS